MKIKIDEIGQRVQIDIKPRDYILTKGDDVYPYALSPRIDMSYAGKPDQWASPVLFLDEDQYHKLRILFDEAI